MIETPGGKIIAKPGTMVKLTWNNESWGFVLIGSSLNVPKSTKIAEEIPDFSADYLVYKLK